MPISDNYFLRKIKRLHKGNSQQDISNNPGTGKRSEENSWSYNEPTKPLLTDTTENFAIHKYFEADYIKFRIPIKADFASAVFHTTLWNTGFVPQQPSGDKINPPGDIMNWSTPSASTEVETVMMQGRKSSNAMVDSDLWENGFDSSNPTPISSVQQQSEPRTPSLPDKVTYRGYPIELHNPDGRISPVQQYIESLCDFSNIFSDLNMQIRNEQSTLKRFSTLPAPRPSPPVTIKPLHHTHSADMTNPNPNAPRSFAMDNLMTPANPETGRLTPLILKSSNWRCRSAKIVDITQEWIIAKDEEIFSAQAYFCPLANLTPTLPEGCSPVPESRELTPQPPKKQGDFWQKPRHSSPVKKYITKEDYNYLKKTVDEVASDLDEAREQYRQSIDSDALEIEKVILEMSEKLAKAAPVSKAQAEVNEELLRTRLAEMILNLPIYHYDGTTKAAVPNPPVVNPAENYELIKEPINILREKLSNLEKSLVIDEELSIKEELRQITKNPNSPTSIKKQKILRRRSENLARMTPLIHVVKNKLTTLEDVVEDNEEKTAARRSGKATPITDRRTLHELLLKINVEINNIHDLCRTSRQIDSLNTVINVLSKVCTHLDTILDTLRVWQQGSNNTLILNVEEDNVAVADIRNPEPAAARQVSTHRRSIETPPSVISTSSFYESQQSLPPPQITVHPVAAAAKDQQNQQQQQPQFQQQQLYQQHQLQQQTLPQPQHPQQQQQPLPTPRRSISSQADPEMPMVNCFVDLKKEEEHEMTNTFVMFTSSSEKSTIGTSVALTFSKAEENLSTAFTHNQQRNVYDQQDRATAYIQMSPMPLRKLMLNAQKEPSPEKMMSPPPPPVPQTAIVEVPYIHLTSPNYLPESSDTNMEVSIHLRRRGDHQKAEIILPYAYLNRHLSQIMTGDNASVQMICEESDAGTDTDTTSAFFRGGVKTFFPNHPIEEESSDVISFTSEDSPLPRHKLLGQPRSPYLGRNPNVESYSNASFTILPKIQSNDSEQLTDEEGDDEKSFVQVTNVRNSLNENFDLAKKKRNYKVNAVLYPEQRATTEVTFLRNQVDVDVEKMSEKGRDSAMMLEEAFDQAAVKLHEPSEYSYDRQSTPRRDEMSSKYTSTSDVNTTTAADLSISVNAKTMTDKVYVHLEEIPWGEVSMTIGDNNTFDNMSDTKSSILFNVMVSENQDEAMTSQKSDTNMSHRSSQKSLTTTVTTDKTLSNPSLNIPTYIIKHLSTASITCELNNYVNKESNMEWFKGKEPLRINKSHGKYDQISHDLLEVLVINKIEYDDSELYSIKVNGELYPVAYLIVEDTGANTNSSMTGSTSNANNIFLSPPKTMFVCEGQKTQISCQMKESNLNIAWYRDQGIIQESNRIHLLSTNDGWYHVIIDETYTSDSGTYYSYYEDSSTYITLVVEGLFFNLSFENEFEREVFVDIRSFKQIKTVK
uniref:Ig-like domain-containing protein n=1 Tax=Panagrolaimus sp. ES5 TaxID=591445 RepID=A0AC34F8Q9_9BILA